MNWEKTSVFSILLIMSILMISSITMMGVVSAQNPITDSISENIQKVIDTIQSGGKPVFWALFGDSNSGDTLIIQVLAFILAVLVIYGILDIMGLFEDKKILNFLIALVVAVIGIRFIPTGLLESLAIPSSAFIALIVFAVPFLLIGVVMHKSSLPPEVRKAIWAAYGAIILVLWIYNWQNVKGWSWVYIVMLVACVVVFWFDGTLAKWWRGGKLKKIESKVYDTEKDMILSDIQNLQGAYRAALKAGDTKKAGKLRKQINDMKEGL